MSYLDSIFGNSGSVMYKDSLGNYKTDFWTPEQWQEAGRLGINVGKNGEMLDKNGSAIDVKELDGSSEGLGGLFKEGGSNNGNASTTPNDNSSNGNSASNNSGSNSSNNSSNNSTSTTST